MVWINSRHTHLVDVQLRHSMRIVTGTLLSTPVQWLPVLSNIPPPHIRRQKHLVHLWSRMLKNTTLPIHEDVSQLRSSRLKSRKPACKTALELINNQFNHNDTWRNEWSSSMPHGIMKITDPALKLNGFNLPRHAWCRLNRVRCGVGRTASALHKWGWIDSPFCDCADIPQSMEHIVLDCPLRAFPGNVEDLNSATPEAICWLKSLDTGI